VSISISKNTIGGRHCVVQVRFDEAYRYLDKCGEAISRIRAIDRRWVPRDPVPQGADLVLPEKQLSLQLNTSHFTMSAMPKAGTRLPSYLDIENAAEAIASQIDRLLEVVIELFQPPNTTRVGARFSFMAQAESLADCEAFLYRATKGDFQHDVGLAFSSQAYTGSARVNVEDEKTGYRRTVALHTAFLEIPEGERDEGFSDTRASKYFVEIDIDCYTRPTSGHFVGLPMFIRTAYPTAFEGASKLFTKFR
jgi:hypothetical protein